jgi:putative DNA primase/helicase
VAAEAMDWLWPDFLARGKVHLLAGAPGVGKTLVALRLAGIISSGAQWPDGSKGEVGDVLLWTGEDGLRDTIIPRLQAAGADMTRCHLIAGVAHGKLQRPFDPARDVGLLKKQIAHVENPALLIIDPIVSAVAGDSHKNAEVRRSLQPLVELAASTRCALLGVTHFSKGTAGRTPVERVTGSLAFGALARLVFVAGTRERSDDGRQTREHFLVRAKSNLGFARGGFLFTIDATLVSGDVKISAPVVTFTSAIDD